VPDGCCQCSAGGKQRAIAKKADKAWQAALTKKCAEIVCPMMISNDPTCSQRAVCVAGHCALK
jgi:hypothetical protein